MSAAAGGSGGPRPIPAPAAPPGRYTRRPLPPYRHVPGLTPHPVNHPEGHSAGSPEPAPPPEAASLPEGWRDCEDYLYGVDLFNRHYFWEAHEAWELLWHGARRDTTIPGRFLQGLIQTSAAFLQLHLERRRGVAYLLGRSGRHLDRVAAALAPGVTDYMGIDLPAWQPRVARYLAGRGGELPYIVLREIEPLPDPR